MTSSPLPQPAQQIKSNVTAVPPSLLSERNSTSFEVAFSNSKSSNTSLNMLEDQEEIEEEKRAWNEALFEKYEQLSLNCTEHIPFEWQEWMRKHPPPESFNVCTSCTTFSVRV